MSFGGLLGSLYGDLAKQDALNKPITTVNKDIAGENVVSTVTEGGAEARANEAAAKAGSKQSAAEKEFSNSGEAPCTNMKQLAFTTETDAPLKAIINEYDPTKPNIYEEILAERERKQRAEEEARRREEFEALRSAQREAERQRVKDAADLNITGEEAWRRRGDRRDFAQRLLEKMGWKSGEGLGRDKQGMIAPLVARKTDKRSGVIVPAPTPTAFFAPPMPSPMPGPGPVPPTATRILLLTNLVGRGEADASLEAEATEEACKYGNLLSVFIEELADAPEDECVRIFCEVSGRQHSTATPVVGEHPLSLILQYESRDSAAKASLNFNGRMFGGRVVKAQFFPEAEFYAKKQVHDNCND